MFHVSFSQQERRAQQRSCKTFPGADCNSDHSLLMANIVCKVRKLKKPKTKSNLDLTTLKNDADIQKCYANINNTAEDWNQIEEVFQNTAKQLLPPKPQDRK